MMRIAVILLVAFLLSKNANAQQFCPANPKGWFENGRCDGGTPTRYENMPVHGPGHDKGDAPGRSGSSRPDRGDAGDNPGSDDDQGGTSGEVCN